MKIFLCLLLSSLNLTICAARLCADELPRRAVIGVTLGPADTSHPENVRTNPPSVKAVNPKGAGAAAGIQVGDVVRDIDGAAIQSSADFAARIARHLAGDRVSISIVRGGQEAAKVATLKPRPYESNPDAEILYESVNAGGFRRRTIVTRPKTDGRYPAVLVIGGLGCYSLDGEILRPTGYGPILAALAKDNFVTMRVEKSGQGDSEGPACTDPKSTADLEAEGYFAALRALKNYSFVDSSRVFIFAHSLGPLVASLVLPREPVRGFIAAETIGRSWYEYGLENVRRQSALSGESLDEVDADVRTHATCAFHFYMLHETADEVSKLGPQCAAMIRSYAGMPYTYMQQIGDLSLGKQWKQADTAALVIYGTSDPATSADESRYLVNLINSFHPGRATYLELDAMGHDFALYASQQEFLGRQNDAKQHAYDPKVVEAIVSWLKEHLHA
jgi:pimeloyl-ACP methyl ester carboxylesterase